MHVFHSALFPPGACDVVTVKRNLPIQERLCEGSKTRLRNSRYSAFLSPFTRVRNVLETFWGTMFLNPVPVDNQNILFHRKRERYVFWKKELFKDPDCSLILTELLQGTCAFSSLTKIREDFETVGDWRSQCKERCGPQA